MARKPKCIIFDLDYTLWPFWVDTHVNPPFKKNSQGVIVDSTGHKVVCYPEVPQVLNKLHKEGYTLGYASRTSEIEGARQLVNLFGWNKYFTYKEVFPGCKITHLTNIKKQSSINFEDILFFDDEERNIRDLLPIGVVAYLVKNGITKKAIEQGLAEFEKQRS